MKKLTSLFALVIVASLLLAACGAPAAPAAATQPAAAPAVTDTQAPAAPAATDTPAAAAPAATEAPAGPTATIQPTPVVTPAPGAVQITFWSWVPHISEAVDQFNKTHPDIYVNYVNAGGGSGEYNKLKVALQANTDVPDVVQIEYQLVPSFIAQDALLDLTPYGAAALKDMFVPWTWTQVTSGTGIYALPQDAGPMVMFCNDAVLSKFKVTAPKTWDEFGATAAAIHTADPKSYLSNFTYDQGWFFGVIWQAGARPFSYDGKQTVGVNFTSPEAQKVTKFWGDLIKSGNLSPVDTYTNDWNTALGNGSVACWPSGSWGTFISGSSKDFAGKWSVYPMPSWKAGDKVNGNYGGSTIAVTKASQHPKEAAAFDTWLNTDAKITLSLTNPDGAGLFPVTKTTLADPAWKDIKYDFWSGQAIHQTMLDAGNQVDVNFTWGPFTDFVFTTYADEMTKVKAGTITYDQVLQDLQDKSVGYAKDQGFTVK